MMISKKAIVFVLVLLIAGAVFIFKGQDFGSDIDKVPGDAETSASTGHSVISPESEDDILSSSESSPNDEQQASSSSTVSMQKGMTEEGSLSDYELTGETREERLQRYELEVADINDELSADVEDIQHLMADYDLDLSDEDARAALSERLQDADAYKANLLAKFKLENEIDELKEKTE